VRSASVWHTVAEKPTLVVFTQKTKSSSAVLVGGILSKKGAVAVVTAVIST